MTTNPGLFIQTQFIPGIIVSHGEFVTNYFSLWHSILSESQQINIDRCSFEAQRSVQALWAFSSPDGWSVWNEHFPTFLQQGEHLYSILIPQVPFLFDANQSVMVFWGGSDIRYTGDHCHHGMFEEEHSVVYSNEGFLFCTGTSYMEYIWGFPPFYGLSLINLPTLWIKQLVNKLYY